MLSILLSRFVYNFIVTSPLCKKWSKQLKHPDENTINWYIASPSLARAAQSRRTACKFQKKPLEVFFKKDVLKNFAKFTGKHLCQSLFYNKVADMRPATLLKKRLVQFFSMNISTFLRTPILKNICGRLLLKIVVNLFRALIRVRSELFCKAGVLINITKFTENVCHWKFSGILCEIFKDNFFCGTPGLFWIFYSENFSLNLTSRKIVHIL